MTPAASRRFRVYLTRSQGYTAEIKAPSAEAAEIIAAFLVENDIWEHAFDLEHSFDDMIEAECIDAEASA